MGQSQKGLGEWALCPWRAGWRWGSGMEPEGPRWGLGIGGWHQPPAAWDGSGELAQDQMT